MMPCNRAEMPAAHLGHRRRHYIFHPAHGLDAAAALQLDMHEIFRSYVESRRDGKFKVEDPRSLMNGDVFLGDKALELGLVDGVGDLRSTMRARFGEKVQLKLVNKPKRGLPLLNLLGSHADPLGNTLTALEQRALWGRYGL